MILNNVPYNVVYSTDNLSQLTQSADSRLLQQQNISQIEQLPAQLSAQPEAQSAQQLYDLGVEAHQAGQIDAAIQAYQDAIQLDPKFDSAYINLGLAFIQEGQLENAKNTFQQVLALPDRPEQPASIHTIAHYNLAIILRRQGATNEAITEVQQALAITPDFERAQQLLQRLQPSP